MRAILHIALVLAATVNAAPSNKENISSETNPAGRFDKALGDFVERIEEAEYVFGVLVRISDIIIEANKAAGFVLGLMMEDINKAFNDNQRRDINLSVEQVRSSATGWRTAWYEEIKDEQDLPRFKYTANQVVEVLANYMNDFLEALIKQTNAKPEQIFVSPEALEQLSQAGKRLAANLDEEAPAYVQQKVEEFKDAINVEYMTSVIAGSGNEETQEVVPGTEADIKE